MSLARVQAFGIALCFFVTAQVHGSLEEDFFLKLHKASGEDASTLSDEEIVLSLPFPQDLAVKDLGPALAYIDTLDACVEEFSQVLKQDQLGATCLERISSSQSPPCPEELSLMNDLLLDNETLQQKLNIIYDKMILQVPGVCAILPQEIRACIEPKEGLFFSQVHAFIRLMRLYTTAHSFADRLFTPLRRAVYFYPIKKPVEEAFEYIISQHDWFKGNLLTALPETPEPTRKKTQSFRLEDITYVHKVVSTHEGLTYFFHLLGNPPLYKTFKRLQGDAADEILKTLNETLNDPKVTPYMQHLLWSITPHKNIDVYTAFSQWFIQSDKVTLAYAKKLYNELSKMMNDFGPLTEHDSEHFRLFFYTAAMHLDGKGCIKIITPTKTSTKTKVTKKRKGRGKRP